LGSSFSSFWVIVVFGCIIFVAEVSLDFVAEVALDFEAGVSLDFEAGVSLDSVAEVSLDWVAVFRLAEMGWHEEGGKGAFSDVPTWNSQPELWNDYVADCRWYVSGLQRKDRCLAAARLLRRLTGAAKRYVMHLDARDFEKDDGADRLLKVLQESPLGVMPIPDVAQRIEVYFQGTKRKLGESMGEYMVKEEENYTRLAKAVKRVHENRVPLAEPRPRAPTPDVDEGYDEEQEEEAEDPQDEDQWGALPRRRRPRDPEARSARSARSSTHSNKVSTLSL